MLKALIVKTAFDALPAEMQGHYKAATIDGFYVLDVEAVSQGSSSFSLEDVSGLKSALSKERESAARLKKIADQVGDLDLDAARAAMAKLEELSKNNPSKKLDEEIEAVRQQLTAKYGNEVATRDKRIDQLSSQLERSLIDSAATKALAAHKGSPELLLPHVQKQTRIVEKDGALSVEVIDKSGVPRISSKSGSTDLMTIEELVAEMKNDAVFSRAFDGSGATGSGAAGSGGAGRTGGFSLSTADARDPHKYRAAKEAAAKAGTELTITE